MHMATEIELKAWAENTGAIRGRLERIAVFTGSFDKEDGYWFPKRGNPPENGTPALPSSGLRVRKERDVDPEGAVSSAVHVTYKTKEVRDGIEINDEREFDVSSGCLFEELLGRLGLEKGKAKRKRGRSYSVNGITAELTEIDGLGWFVELEILAAGGDAETTAAARRRLFGLLAELGVPENAVETRYYTEMLTERFKEGAVLPPDGGGRR
jgi:adenylate cyclase class 2